MIFDRVFNGHYFDLGCRDACQECVQRCCFSGTGRARIQYHAIGLRDLAEKNFFQILIKTKSLQGKRNGRWIQNTHDDRLRVVAREHRGAYLDLFSAHDDGKTTVLRGILNVQLETRE